MSENERFDRMADEIWARLKSGVLSEFRDQVNRIELIIMDEPDADLVNELSPDLAAHADELFGLHFGVPITEESLQFPQIEPIRVYLFRKALLAEADGDPKILREEIAITLLHEIGHHFGLEDDDLERLGFG